MARKLILSLAAASLALGAVSTASARGYHGHHHRHHGHYHKGGGGKGAAIALGVIGGAIILNELAEDRARDRYRDRYYEDRYYESRARERAYEDGYYDGRAADSRYDDRYEDDAYYGDDDAYYGDESYDDTGLAGAGPVEPAPVYRTPDTNYDRAPRRISAAAAYQTCLDKARGALGERGFVVSAPYRPDTVEDRGGALLMTATVRAQRGGDSWARAMSCEASENRVYRLELI